MALGDKMPTIGRNPAAESACASSGTGPIGQDHLLPESERTRLLAQWNDTARAVAPTTLAELFEAQVARTAGSARRSCSTAVPSATRTWKSGRTGWPTR